MITKRHIIINYSYIFFGIFPHLDDCRWYFFTWLCVLLRYVKRNASIRWHSQTAIEHFVVWMWSQTVQQSRYAGQHRCFSRRADQRHDQPWSSQTTHCSSHSIASILLECGENFEFSTGKNCQNSLSEDIFKEEFERFVEEIFLFENSMWKCDENSSTKSFICFLLFT